MTYRRFKTLYTAARKEAAPDISLPAADPRPRARFTPRMALAAVAALAVLAGGLALWRLSENSPSSVPISPAGPVSSAPTEPINLPTQPGPDKIPVSETVRVIPALHAGTPLAELVTAEAPATVTEAFVFPYTDTVSEDHSQCVGVYYNAADGTLFCCAHAARELLKKQGLPGKNVRTKCFLPSQGLLLFTLEDVKGHPSYCADLKTGALHRINVDLYHSGSKAGGVVQELNDTLYALVFVTGDRKDDLYLINLERITVKCLSDVYPAMDDYRLSRGGQYVCYTLNGDHANDPARTSVLYRIEGGEWQTFTGEVLDELPDDSLFVIRTPDGVRAYDPAAGETRPLSALPEGYRRGVSVTDRYTSYGSECHLQTTDYQTGETHTLTTPYLSAWACSGDRRTLYYYVRGEDQIHILDLVTGEEQVTAVDERLAEETETGDASTRAVWFTLTVLPEEQLLLEYRVSDAPREDPEAIRQELENDAAWQYARWHEANPDPTVASMGDLLKRFPAEGIVAYQGEGYLYLDYTCLFTGSQNRQILFEDYRTGLGYQILHDWNSLHAPFHLSGKNRTGYFLPADAQAAALQALTDAGIPILPAERDYGVYFTDGVPDMLAVLQDSLKAEVFLPQVGTYTLFVAGRDAGEARWGLNVAEDVWDFWRFTDGLDYRYLGNSDEYGRYIWDNKYSVHFGMIHLFMGRREGKPFLMRMDEVAPISEKEYEKWGGWIREKWPEQFVDPLADT